MLNRVCLDYRRLQAEVPDPGRISLNLSLKQLREASFILRCRSVFRSHGVSPDHFELEITESTLMADTQRTVRLLGELHTMGLHFRSTISAPAIRQAVGAAAVPHRRTRRSISSRVREGSPRSAGDVPTVRTIIDMGRSLGLDVVAEGIESQRHLDFLCEHRCQYGQGKLFSEPNTIDALLALLARQAAGEAPFGHLIHRTGLASRRA